MCKIINISNFIEPDTRTCSYTEIEYTLILKVIKNELSTISALKNGAIKEDLVFIRKAIKIFDRLMNKINNKVFEFSFIECDYLLGTLISALKDDSDKYTLIECQNIISMIKKTREIYISYKEKEQPV